MGYWDLLDQYLNGAEWHTAWPRLMTWDIDLKYVI